MRSMAMYLKSISLSWKNWWRRKAKKVGTKLVVTMPLNIVQGYLTKAPLSSNLNSIMKSSGKSLRIGLGTQHLDPRPISAKWEVDLRLLPITMQVAVLVITQ
jgi:hypothetical protein